MTKYLLRRILHGIVSICIVVGIVMIMIYSMLDRNQIFASDPQYSKVSNNDKTVYKYRTWKEYGYIDYITYSDYLQKLVADGLGATDLEDERANGPGDEERAPVGAGVHDCEAEEESEGMEPEPGEELPEEREDDHDRAAEDHGARTPVGAE